MDYLISAGSEVKSLGDGKIGGYLVLFGDETKRDLEGEYFTPDTDFGDIKQTAVYYQHGQDPDLGRRVIGSGVWEVKDAGVWLEAQLDLRDEYDQAIMQLVEAGKLGWSSGTAGYLTERTYGKITRWPLALDASLTPTPAEPRTMAMSLKSLINPQQDEAQAAPTAPVEADDNKTVEPEFMEDNIMTDQTNSDRITAAEIKAMWEEFRADVSAEITAKTAGIVTPSDEVKPAADVKTAWRAFLNPRSAKSIYAKALEGGTDSEGGYTVPTDEVAELIAPLTEGSIIRQAGARSIMVNTDTVTFPSLTNSTTAILTAEEGAYSEVDPSFGQLSFTPYKYTKLTKVTEELAADSLFDIWSQVLAPDFANAFVLAENGAFTTGTGSSQPQGVSVGATTGKTAASATAITADEVIDLYHSLSYLYRSNAVWMMNDSTIAAIRKLKDGDSQYLWQPGLSAGQPDTILGRPVITNNSMPTAAADAATIVIGDFSYYWIADRAGVSVSVNPYLYMANGYIGYFANKRFDGKIAQAAAFRKLVQASS